MTDSNDRSTSESGNEAVVSIAKTSSRRLALAYGTAITFVFLFVSAEQFVLQSMMPALKESSGLINMAGRQRMLSQSITKQTLLLATETVDPVTGKAELEQQIGRWQVSHEHLVNAFESGALESPVVTAQLQEIEASMAELVEVASIQLTAETGPLRLTREAVTRLHEAERRFLGQMEGIVKQIEIESNERDQALSQLELALYGGFLFVLLVEILLIFRPAIRWVDRAIDELARLEGERSASLAALESEHDKLLESYALVERLSGHQNICCYCHSMKDEEGDWSSITKYLTKKTDLTLSHGICPSCYEEIDKEIDAMPASENSTLRVV